MPSNQIQIDYLPMSKDLMSLGRRALAAHDPALNLRYFCSPPSSSSAPPNNKLFVGGLSLFLSHRRRCTCANCLFYMSCLIFYWALQVCRGRLMRSHSRRPSVHLERSPKVRWPTFIYYPIFSKSSKCSTKCLHKEVVRKTQQTTVFIQPCIRNHHLICFPYCRLIIL